MFRSFADVVMPEDLRDYVKVPGDRRRQAPDHHGGADAGLQGLPAPARRAHQGDRGARPARRSPATTSCSPSSPTAGMPRSTCAWSIRRRATKPDNKLNALIAQRLPHLEGDRRAHLSPQGRQALREARRRPADLLRSRHDRGRGHARLLGLSLDQERTRPPRRAGVRDRLHAGLQEVRGEAAPVQRLQRRQGPLPDRLVRHDGHRRQCRSFG